MDYNTRSSAVSMNGKLSWLKISLGKVYCVQQLVRRNGGNEVGQVWDCTVKDCRCVARTGKEGCDILFVTVSTEGVSRDLPPISSCSHGNTVTYGRKYGGGPIGAPEILIIGTVSGKGKILDLSLHIP